MISESRAIESAILLSSISDADEFIAVTISEPSSMPSSVVPRVDTSRPSTVPVTAMLPCTWSFCVAVAVPMPTLPVTLSEPSVPTPVMLENEPEARSASTIVPSVIVPAVPPETALKEASAPSSVTSANVCV